MAFVREAQKQRERREDGEGEFKGMTRLPHSKEQNKHNQVNADLGSTRTLPAPSLTGI